MATIKQHYEQLKTTDFIKYNKFRSALVLQDQLRYFERSVCSKSYNLRNVKSWTRSMVVNYLNFDHDDFDDNNIPELQKQTV
jgi:hypothetical protein